MMCVFAYFSALCLFESHPHASGFHVLILSLYEFVPKKVFVPMKQTHVMREWDIILLEQNRMS